MSPFPSLSPEWHLSSRDIRFLDADGPSRLPFMVMSMTFLSSLVLETLAPWLWWLSQSHVLILLRDVPFWRLWRLWKTCGDRGCVTHIWFPLLPFPVYHGPTWEVSTGPSALNSQHLSENSISHHDSFSTLSLGTSAISWSHSLLLSYLTSLFSLENYLTLHLSNIIATSHIGCDWMSSFQRYRKVNSFQYHVSFQNEMFTALILALDPQNPSLQPIGYARNF